MHAAVNKQKQIYIDLFKDNVSGNEKHLFRGVFKFHPSIKSVE